MATIAMRSESIDDEVYMPAGEPMSPGVDYCRDPLLSRRGERKRSEETGYSFAERMRKISVEYGLQKQRGNGFVSKEFV